MAKFEMELPTDMIKAFERMNVETKDMLGEMTQAGAEQVLKNIKANAPASFLDSDIMSCLHITKVYKTPSDDGINTKVAFYGYFINKRGVRTPAELVCNIFEYGRSDNKVKKRPFVRKSFKAKNVQTAMQKKQDEWLEKFEREFKIT
jgi:hypothetical protein